jgi:hypothetical protein
VSETTATRPGSSLPAEPSRSPSAFSDERARRHRAGGARSFHRLRQGGLAGLAAAFGIYLLAASLLWWHVWSTHPAGVAVCGCNDPALFLWMLDWPAHAIAHGHSPFFSTAMFHPSGINLLSNTSVLAIGIPLAPITWLWGPVATLNVASTLVPAISATAMFWLLRRWQVWWPAALAGGLLFGFSPFVLDNLAVAHLMTAALFLLPLVVACLEELLLRQERSPWAVGAALGVIAALQFFLGTEILAIAAVCAVAGIGLLVLYAAICDRHAIVARAPRALVGLGTAVAVAVTLLAYPAWFALRGRSHLSGLVWPKLAPGSGGITVSSLWRLSHLNPHTLRLYGGYGGPPLPEAQYLGPALGIVVLVGVVLSRRDRRMWFFGALGAVSIALAVGIQKDVWTPWRRLAHVPVLQNAAPARFFAVTTMCVAVMLAITIDRVRVLARASSARHVRSQSPRSALPATMGSLLCGLAVAAVALVPVGIAEGANVPMTTEQVSLPSWFAHEATKLTPPQVVLAFPPPFASGGALAWQAVDSFHFALASGGGPGSIPSRAGAEQRAVSVLDEASAPLSAPPPVTPGNVDAIRNALVGWGVTIVVVADPNQIVPRYQRTASISWALGAFTLVLGRPPDIEDDAWVWNVQPNALGQPRAPLSRAAFARCTSAADPSLPALDSVARCVMASSVQST